MRSTRGTLLRLTQQKQRCHWHARLLERSFEGWGGVDSLFLAVGLVFSSRATVLPSNATGFTLLAALAGNGSGFRAIRFRAPSEFSLLRANSFGLLAHLEAHKTICQLVFRKFFVLKCLPRGRPGRNVGHATELGLAVPTYGPKKTGKTELLTPNC